MLAIAVRMAVSGVRRSWLSEASSADDSSARWRVSSERAPILEKLRTLDRDRDDAGDGVARAGLELAPAGRQQTDGARSRFGPAQA